ncbi:MAG: TonB family protein [Chitinophagales bacterium]|jgi:TonB family protein|nr:TonB family protein [Chitinophagales bacterium]
MHHKTSFYSNTTVQIIKKLLLMAAFLMPILPSMAKTLPYLNLIPPQDSIYEENEVDIPPTFGDNYEDLVNYISSNIKYPKAAKENGVEGTVYVSFYVDIDGSVANIRLIRGSSYFRNEVLRVIATMPKWNAGQLQGKFVKVKMVVPVKFKLSDDRTNLTTEELSENEEELSENEEELSENEEELSENEEDMQAIEKQDSIDHVLIQQYVVEHKLVGQYTLSGVFYVVEKEGKGEKPTIADTIVVDYKGSFLNGKKFDSSYDKGKAAQFPVAGIQKGWQDTITLFKEGSKVTIIIPSHLAYGNRGARPVILPNTILLFNIELLKVIKNK